MVKSNILFHKYISTTVLRDKKVSDFQATKKTNCASWKN